MKHLPPDVAQRIDESCAECIQKLKEGLGLTEGPSTILNFLNKYAHHAATVVAEYEFKQHGKRYIREATEEVLNKMYQLED